MNRTATVINSLGHIASWCQEVFALSESGHASYTNDSLSTRLTTSDEVIHLSRIQFAESGIRVWCLSLRVIEIGLPTVPLSAIHSYFSGDFPDAVDIARLAVVDSMSFGKLCVALRTGYGVDKGLFKMGIDKAIRDVHDGFVPRTADQLTRDYLKMIRDNRG